MSKGILANAFSFRPDLQPLQAEIELIRLFNIWQSNQANYEKKEKKSQSYFVSQIFPKKVN